MSEPSDLLRRWSAGTASPEEAARLALLLRDAEVRTRLAEQVRFDHVLVEGLRGLRARRQAPSPGQATARLMRSRRRPAPRGAGLGLAASLAAVAALAAVLWTMSPARPAAPALAVVEGVEGAAEAAGRRLRIGDQLRPGDELVVAGGGAIRLRCAGSGHLAFAGDSAASLTGGPQGLTVALARGEVEADVERQADGRTVRVRTRLGEATVLGTRFTVSAASAETRLAVAHGRVRFARLADGAALEVAAGQSARIADGVPFTVEGAVAGMAPGAVPGGGAPPDRLEQDFARDGDLTGLGVLQDRLRVDRDGELAIRMDPLPGADPGEWSAFAGVLGERVLRPPFTVSATVRYEGRATDALATVLLKPVAGRTRELRVDFRDGSYDVARQITDSEVEWLVRAARTPAWPDRPERWTVRVAADGAVRLDVDGVERATAMAPELLAGCRVGIGAKARGSLQTPMVVRFDDLVIDWR